MLEKIENISRNKSYKRKRHSAGFDQIFNKQVEPAKNVKDSISFSPAAVYLASLKWTIREIEYSSPDNVNLIFFIGEFEFRTKVNVTDYFNEPRQLFYVSRAEIGSNTKNKVTIKINVKKLLVKSLTTNSYVDVGVLREVFDRAKELKIIHNFDTNDSSMINEIQDGYEERLYNEFSKIINNIYTFINKHDRFHVPNQFTFNDNNHELISIEEISTYYS